MLVHVVNIKLNSFNNWKALGLAACAACTAVATLVNPLHKPNKNWKYDNSKDQWDYCSLWLPIIYMWIFTKIRYFLPCWLIPDKKGNNGTYQRDAKGYPSMFVWDTDFVAFTWHARVWSWLIVLYYWTECPSSKAWCKHQCWVDEADFGCLLETKGCPKDTTSLEMRYIIEM